MSAPRWWRRCTEFESRQPDRITSTRGGPKTASQARPHDRIRAQVSADWRERPPQAPRDAARTRSTPYRPLSRRELSFQRSRQVDPQHHPSAAGAERRAARRPHGKRSGEIQRRCQDAGGNGDRGPRHARDARRAPAARLSRRLDLPQATVGVDARRSDGHARRPRLWMVRRARGTGRCAARDGAQPRPRREQGAPRQLLGDGEKTPAEEETHESARDPGGGYSARGGAGAVLAPSDFAGPTQIVWMLVNSLIPYSDSSRP